MTWNVLKWVAIAAMFIDHTAAVMGGLFPFSWYDPMRDVGRIAFPIFAYGIAQGCVYTHSARRYLGRLLLFAVLSEIPYRLALRAGSLAFGLFNVFFTLLAGAACCQIVKFCRSKGRRWAWAAVVPVAAIVLLCEILGTDYGGFGVLCILLPYLFWESKPARITALALVVAFLLHCGEQLQRVFLSPVVGGQPGPVLVYGSADSVRPGRGGTGGPVQRPARLEKRQVGVLHLFPRPPAGAVAAPRRRRFDHLLFRGGIFMKRSPL